ncbi:uncharacterized protein J8A68_004505 [[Candida] subhashii]|uniref:Selenoprotein O n=1 Tax=[Candida] subhashii TaxID=561895 RepID=A0A8J5QSJ9_9ASCO|nr:uncharacterized protein J8A68_004505 [[Candida] subhashii]KAG7662005.1 hypothetical protein J8A68_004505 [[Candida] subhashii]
MTHTKKLIEIPKTQSFTNSIKPDNRIPTIETALKNENDITTTPRNLLSGAFSWTLPTPRKDYQYLTASEPALADLDLDPDQASDPVFQLIISGEIYEDKITFEKEGLPMPYSQAYAGWQFGQFAGQLGDGRVVNLFEIPKRPDLAQRDFLKNRNLYELQLKGAGKTPYSRFADGKAVLRSSIREYIMSEHLNAIGIPTTRALALTYLPTTYAQRYAAEKCAIVARFAESWVRLGSFDLYRWRGDREGIRELSDYVISELFTINNVKFPNFERISKLKPELFQNPSNSIGELSEYDKMFYETVVRNAETIAMTQCYGFLNGVLNTDNTSVLGLTIDFGPFSIMDKYDPSYTPNSEDHEHRYGYRNTPTAMWWNLTRFGEDLAELIGAGPDILADPEFKNGIKLEWEEGIIKRATKVIGIGGEMFQYAFTKKYVETMYNRLGLSHGLIDEKNPDLMNVDVIAPMLEMLRRLQIDFNLFFLKLQELDLSSADYVSVVENSLLNKNFDFESLRYPKDLLLKDIADWLRLYHTLQERSSTSEVPPPDPKKYNPLFLPRNWILDQVIKQAQDSKCEDITYLKKLEKMSFYPFDRSKWGDELKEVEESWLLQGDKGEEFAMLQCGCSS